MSVVPSSPGAARRPGTVCVFAGPGSWIESEAVDQCHQVAALDGVLHVAGMPDLHPGKGAPIGAAIRSTLLYPHLVGSDIGCGIAVFPVSRVRADPERLAARFPDLDAEPDIDDPVRELAGSATRAGDDLGTVGRGNHFAELARVADILHPAHAARLGVAAGSLVLLVHSGSRGLGERILRSHTERHGAAPAPDPAGYLQAHDAAARWARLNRRVIAERVARAIGARLGEPLVDLSHNLVEATANGYLHRKGAAPGAAGDVLVAGSRGTPSYLVAAHAGPEANHSVAHGAGRKMSRADALVRNRAKHSVDELRRTPLGSVVVCGDRRLLFEEAPAAYKRIEQVIADLEAHGLATAVAATVPLVTYKTAGTGERRPAGLGRRDPDRRARAGGSGRRRADGFRP